MAAIGSTPTDESNAQQLAAWDGEQGAYWAAHAAQFDRAIAGYHQPFLDAAAIADGETVLDVGCGAGQSTCDAARRTPSSTALGVDLSARMLAVARQRAAADGLANVRFEQADAQVHPFETASFDVAISRCGTMFFGDRMAAFTNIARAVRPGGRLVLLTWRPFAEQEWMQQITGALAAGRSLPSPPPDAPGPFSLSEPDDVRAVLTTAGFTDVSITAADEGMSFGADVADAHRFVLGMLGWMVDELDEQARAAALEALQADMAAHLTDHGVLYGSAAWRITATRT